METIWADKQLIVAVLSVAALSEVLALHDLFHNVILNDLCVVYPGWMALHQVLLLLK